MISFMSTKGEETRQRILEGAVALASTQGIEGVTIGDLASALDLSKSGLFAHFRSKEALQIAVLQAAAERFTRLVVVPALKAPRGEPRVRALFDRWLTWGNCEEMPGGCIFITAAAELDDRPGPVRDVLVQSQKDLLGTVAHAAQIAVDEGHFQGDLDLEQFAFELYAILLSFNHATRLMRDPRAKERAQRTFERLIASARSLH
jgi:AcrR family transcriptional regulator